MKGVRQLGAYGAIGGVQFVLDAALYASIVWGGWPPVLGNVVSRGVAAMAGFWLNSRVTFRDRGAPSWRRRATRYAAVWLLMTVVSSGLIGALSVWIEAPRAPALYVALKLGVEIFLFLVTFMVMRVWVFRGNRGGAAS